MERAELALRRAQRERIPNIDLAVSIRHIYPTDSDVANVQAGIPIPIFDANQGNIHRAEFELVAAEAEIRRVELALQDRLAATYRRYASSGQQVDRYKGRILPQDIKVYEVRYVSVPHTEEKVWPDPLPPHLRPMDLKANENQPFWIKVRVPPYQTPAGGKYLL